MKRKTRLTVIDCAPEISDYLAAILRRYVEAAYPPGGSDCAQVARSTLLQTAEVCTQHSRGALALPKRQLAMLRSAAAWDQTEAGNDGALSALLSQSLATARTEIS